METRKQIEATCPDCRGPLTIRNTDGVVDIICLVGHVYSPRSVLRLHTDAEENALWAGVVSLREVTALVEELQDQFPPEVLEKLRALARKKQEQAAQITAILEDLETTDV